MSRPAIRVEGLWKEYLIGGKPVGQTFREAVVGALDAPLRRLGGRSGSADEVFWALKDVSFEIQPGEVVGVIGRNGAGKSTLLKILSRITAPTKGRVEIRGRIASLLEVGTGFHPELTGRENIRLNAAILGMRAEELARRFDEIVDFSGVEKFLDTPVKRYSSGMSVRLAFAVAAHLDPEILLVDEVLAVGDAEFQRKCLGKMGEIAERGGRTVVFVSHQLGMMSRFCKSGLLFERGKVIANGEMAGVMAEYMGQLTTKGINRASNIDSDVPYLAEIVTESELGDYTSNYLFDQSVVVRHVIQGKILDPRTVLSTTIVSRDGDYVCSAMTELGVEEEGAEARVVTVRFAPGILAPRDFTLRVGLAVLGGRVYDLHETICPFRIIDNGSPMARYEQYGFGQIVIPHDTTVTPIHA